MATSFSRVLASDTTFPPPYSRPNPTPVPDPYVLLYSCALPYLLLISFACHVDVD